MTAAAALVFLAARPAAAQGEQQRARQLFEQGVSAMDGGNPQAAARYFNQSYSLYPRASTACNMALALERTGHACDAQTWYRQCAALDQSGRFRDHANRQASALASQCNRAQPTHNPFVSGPGGSSGGGAQATGGGQVQVVEVGGTQSQNVDSGPGPDHTLLGVGIASLVMGAGAFVGGYFAVEEAWANEALLPDGGGTLVAGTPEADAYNRARTYSNVGIGLYVGGAVLGGLGAILIVVDLAQPGVFGGRARLDAGPRLSFAPTPGGGFGELTVPF